MPIIPENTICPACKTGNQPGSETCANCGGTLAVTKPFVPNKTHRAGMVVVGILFAMPAFVLGLWYLTKKKPEARDEGRYLIIGSLITATAFGLLLLLDKFVISPK